MRKNNLKTKQTKEQKQKIRAQFRELKSKIFETKILEKQNKKIIKHKFNEPTSDNSLRSVKKLNLHPKGIAKLKNKPGNIIDIKKLEKIYISGNTTYKALTNVNISIKKGNIIVIVGPSGSGKSTLLNVISGLDRATRGEIIINDVNISALTNSGLTLFRREYIGFIFQSYNLLPSLSAGDNVEIGRNLQRLPQKRMDVNELFEKIGMKDLVNTNIKNLSGGQQQRVSIARALAKNPEIIFADEPTGALDTQSAEKIIDLLLEINKKYKTTIILVTHNPNLTKIANMVINVTDGKVLVK